MGYEIASGPTVVQPDHGAEPASPPQSPSESQTQSQSQSHSESQLPGAVKFDPAPSERGEPAGAEAAAGSEPLFEFPHILQPLSATSQQRVIADFPALPHGLQSVLDWGFKVAGTATAADLAAHLSQTLRSDDVWVCSPPKCGSMWTQEMVWLLKNNLNYDGCRVMLTERWRFEESRFAADREQRAKIRDERSPEAAAAATAAEPTERSRFVKSHMPMSLQPPRLLDTCKVIYLARNPKDICVSFYNHARRYKTVNFNGELPAFAEHFLDGTVLMTPVVPHMLEAWQRRHHPNLCFVFYEDMKRDLRGQIRRIASFLGHCYSDADVDRLAEYLHIDNFKKNPWRAEDFGKNYGVVNEGEGEFIRTGKTGDWKNHLSEELSERFDRWLERQLRGSDLSFVMELDVQD